MAEPNILKEVYKSDTYKEQMLKRWQVAMTYPLAFLGQFVRTIDVHDEKNPIKMFPAGRVEDDVPDPLLDLALDLIYQGILLFTANSRQCARPDNGTGAE